MSKKKNKKDFWNMTAEEQLEEQDAFSEMEEKGEIDIFSLGKIPKHYTGIEPEITADITRVFGENKSVSDKADGMLDEIFNTRLDESSGFVESLKDDTDKSSVKFDPTINGDDNTPKHAGKEIARMSSSDDKSNHNSIPAIRFALHDNLVKLSDNRVTLYYKLINGVDAIRYVDSDITYDDSVMRDIIYLINYIVAFRHPSALFKFDEYEEVFDNVKGTFIDSDHERKFLFIDFDDYIAGYYFGEPILTQLSKLNLPKESIKIADIIMGLTIESLDINTAFRRSEFESYYNSKSNERNKKLFVDLVRENIDPGDGILMIDSDVFAHIFEKSEGIIGKYVNNIDVEGELSDDDDDDEHEASEIHFDDSIPDDMMTDEEIDDEIASILDHEDKGLSNTEEDIKDDDAENDIDEPDDEDDNKVVIDDSIEEDNIDDLLDEAIEEEESEPESKEIDKVALNNTEGNDSMVIPVTRKQHP